jgi:uncharacterized RDD family membrane protein YckC
VIGASASSNEGSGFARRDPRVAVATPPAREPATESASVPAVEIAAPVDATAELPLFESAPTEIDDTPLITSPRPARPPLSVRRATPDVVRGRSRSSRAPRREEPSDFGLQLDPHEIDAAQVPAGDSRPAPPPPVRAAGAIARLIAMLIDVAVLGSIDAAVLYFTLAIAGLTVDQITQLPVIPLAAFLVILDGGYLIGFTAASGQTIGKMATSIRVISDDGRRVDPAGAVLRAGGCLLTLLTAGLGYLPAFFSLEGRAVQDRVAGTRVVSTR